MSAALGWLQQRVVGRPSAAQAMLLPGKDAPVAGDRLKLLCWNLHFGAGPVLEDARRYSKGEVMGNIEAAAQLIREGGYELVALQEVDLPSDRTAHVDQLRILRQLTGLDHVAFAPNWDARWVPHPIKALPSQQFGRVCSGLAVLSRFPLAGHHRIQLPQPASNGRIHNLFYLYRCMQLVRVDLGRGRHLNMIHSHTEAFDQDNRRQQARIIAEQMRRTATPGVALGDFNALPPEAAVRQAFEDEPHTDMRGDDSVEVLRATGWTDVAKGDFTFPAWAPNRRLDHVFLSPGLRARRSEVLYPEPPASDHCPIEVELALDA